MAIEQEKYHEIQDIIEQLQEGKHWSRTTLLWIDCFIIYSILTRILRLERMFPSTHANRSSSSFVETMITCLLIRSLMEFEHWPDMFEELFDFTSPCVTCLKSENHGNSHGWNKCTSFAWRRANEQNIPTRSIKINPLHRKSIIKYTINYIKAK